MFHDRIEKQVSHVVGECATNEELHGEIVDALRVRLRIRVLGVYPSLREDVAHRPGEGLESLTWTGSLRIDYLVENEVALIAIHPRELNRAALVLAMKSYIALEDGLRRAPHLTVRTHICVPSIRLWTHSTYAPRR